jgi:rhamnose transport system ATP-binding protein
MSVALLQLTAITKSFGAVRALNGVSFNLRAGEVHALLGENGAGKSTLIKVITGAHQPDEGTIQINGATVDHLTPASAHQHGIACIYQQPALFPDLTVAENIGLRLEPNAAMRRVGWRARRIRAKQLLQRIGARISPEAEVRDLSMPEQQLVEIACALGAGARIVIMDEPTASLTRQEVDLLFGIVRELRSSGVGIIYITHRLDEIFALADRVTVLRDGESVGTRSVRDNISSDADPLSSAGNRGSETACAKAPPEAMGPALTESELIRLMVGREIDQVYPSATSAPGEVVLSIRNLSCSFSGVRNVTLDLRAGEIVGLAGLVGAGRTELARVLFGITPADSGEITLNGRAVTIHTPQEAVAHGIAYVPEDRRQLGVVLEMPVAHNISMAIHRRIFPFGWLRFRTERRLAVDFIERLGVRTSGPDAPVSALSGGNQQKVALARWLAAEPKILILDEPTQGVDVGAKAEIHRIIRSLARQGMAVLMISSDLPEVIGMSDRVGVMREGTLVTSLACGCSADELMAAALGEARG